MISGAIGCRLSIISKAKIRYEGILHSIDKDSEDEPVIALNNVRSFGTEDRPCPKPVAPRNDEFQRVVFRGCNLEDVKVIETSSPSIDDCAIVSAGPVSVPHFNDKKDTGEMVSSTQFARSTESSIMAGSDSFFSAFKQPTSPFASTVKSRFSTGYEDNVRGPHAFGDGNGDIDTDAFYTDKRSDYTYKGRQENRNDSRSRNISMQGHPNSYLMNSRENYGYRGGANKGAFSYSGGASQDNFRQRRGYTSNWSNQRNPGSTRHNNWWRPQNSNGQGWSNYKPNQQSKPNYTGDYDYEKASAELAAELENINIAVLPESCSDSVDNVTKSNDSNSSTDDANYYDKTKSFFDAIGSESIDRAKGRILPGLNKRDQRTLNSATFGITSNQYHRRGGGYGGSRYSGNNHRRHGNPTGGNQWRYGGGGGGASNRGYYGSTPAISSGYHVG